MAQAPEKFEHAPVEGKAAIIFTDLDGTLLESDGSVLPDVVRLVRRLGSEQIPVVPVTSKTRREVSDWLQRLEIPGPAIFENGAGVLFAGGVEVSSEAIPAQALLRILDTACGAAGVPVRPLVEIPEDELFRLTGLSPREQRDARSREYSVPFLAPALAETPLLERLRAAGGLSVVRGGRFWHLMGCHTKSGFFDLIRNRCGAWGTSLGLGDAPNDIPILQAVDVPVVISGRTGPEPELVSRFPDAYRPAAFAGAGWVEAIETLVLARLSSPVRRKPFDDGLPARRGK